MKRVIITAAGLLLLAAPAAYGISTKYRQQLEQSGCTQMSEAEGCDINKSKAENAKAGFSNPAAESAPASQSPPYAGQWVAKSSDGNTVATIRIDGSEHVWVNGKKVSAKRSDGALEFKQGMIVYRIQGDRNLKGQDTWHDTDAGTKGPIQPE
ncbi:MAG: hypothetical protein WBF70_07800 [Aeromonas molluscorum]|uniref:hypothetical protein n=1 Tax=Aeromonas molluscorum TaxID=271417 RepID=UPI003CAD6100